jgi:hypothetical protein
MKGAVKMFKWYSVKMGNFTTSFSEVLKQVWNSLIRHHVLDIKWKRVEECGVRW